MKFEDVKLNLKEGIALPLDNIWYHRVLLMKMYNDAGKLPKWPAEIETSEGQVFMRDLMGFLEEEIFEAYEMLEVTELILRKGELTSEDRFNYFVNFNEEIADTLHIFFEVMIYFGIGLAEFNDYYLQLVINRQLLPRPEAIAYKDYLALAIRYADTILTINDDMNQSKLMMGNFNMLNDGLKYKIEDEGLPWEIFEGGKYLSAKLIRKCQYYIFHSLKHLHSARHTLKIKYWRNQDLKPDYATLHNNLMEAWLYYMCFLALCNFNSSRQIENIYLRKHFINVDRIKKEW